MSQRQREEDAIRQKLFNDVFAQFDAGNSGTIKSKDFLNIIDELDALQHEEAAPIMSDQQRENAQTVVEAGITMTKGEVLEFLEHLGVQLGGSEGQSRGTSASQPKAEEPSPLSHARPRSSLLPVRPRTDHKLSKSVSYQGKTISEYDLEATMNTFEQSRIDDLGRGTGPNTPLAQSTPNKDLAHARNLPGKENRRPQASPRRSNGSIFTAVGQGSFSPNVSAGARSSDNEFPFNSEQVQQLHDQIKLLQDREKMSERTIATNEQQIHQLEALLSENRMDMSKNSRLVSELRADCKTAEDNIGMLEQNVEQISSECDQWREKYEKLKNDHEAQAAQSSNAKRISQERTAQVDLLTKELASLEADRKYFQEEKSLLYDQIVGLRNQCAELQETEARLANTIERCNDLEAESDRLKLDLEEVKKASLRQLREEKRAWEKSLEESKGQTLADRREENLRQASQRESDTRATQTEAPDPMDDLLSTDDAVKDQTEAQRQAYKKRHAFLRDELGLQRSLISNLRKMGAAMKKQKERSSADNELASPLAAIFSRRHWHTIWPLIVLYSLVFLLLGYIMATLSTATNAPGVSYAELRSWDRANKLDFILDHHGVLGSRPYHWWEGKWLWIEMAGYWIQDKLQDHAWPS